ncbi:MAG: aldehyde dehydrogenase family protein [Treponema sp.]|jgi:succinate-semialdehyde dehydrogenase/glutarate-semialdehyde dehydrogenase|nr:aldehyde dehydrogenase family protein [Treponema sp.]
MNAADIPAVIEKSRKAQELWAELPYKERARRLKKAAKLLAARRDEITETIHRENGKLSIDALSAEVLPAIMAFSYYTKQGRRFLDSRKIRGGNLLMFFKRSRLVFGPWGVVGIISPWNYPFAIPFSEVVMALLAGNGVILKAASNTPEAGRGVAAVFAAADLPDGLFAHVELPGKEAGPAFIDAGVDKLFFTGSTAVGRELMALAAPRLLPLVLELGGADAALVRKDADLDRAVSGIVWAAYSNGGQSCGGVQRVLVHRDVYEPFLEKICAAVKKLRPGSGPDCDLGPLISIRQKQEVRKQVEACLAGGARIAAQSPGSMEDESPFAPALVLTGVTPQMPVMAAEIFGPVLAVVPAADDQEALKIANSSPYGLTASVWSGNHKQARALAARINAGAVMINDHLMSHGLAETPWGGFGDSGLGRTHGEAGFREMLKTKVIIDDILPGAKRNLWWQPYSEKLYKGIQAIASLAGGPGLGDRLGAIPAVIRVFLRSWGKG